MLEVLKIIGLIGIAIGMTGVWMLIIFGMAAIFSGTNIEQSDVHDYDY